jgi:hypothetical protein
MLTQGNAASTLMMLLVDSPSATISALCRRKKERKSRCATGEILLTTTLVRCKELAIAHATLKLGDDCKISS